MFPRALTVLVTALMGLSLLPSSTLAQEKPFQLSLIGPTMQLVDDDADIKGLRINILYGVNRNVKGMDLGVVNRTTGDFKGLQFGLIGAAHGSFSGWQKNWAVNITEGQFYGLQTGVVNMVGRGEGVQFGPLFNSADHMAGLQISLVNFAEDLDGVQIGVINIIRSKEDFPVLPLVNWKFER